MGASMFLSDVLGFMFEFVLPLNERFSLRETL